MRLQLPFVPGFLPSTGSNPGQHGPFFVVPRTFFLVDVRLLAESSRRDFRRLRLLVDLADLRAALLLLVDLFFVSIRGLEDRPAGSAAQSAGFHSELSTA
jgi:hypothetical protein